MQQEYNKAIEILDRIEEKLDMIEKRLDKVIETINNISSEKLINEAVDSMRERQSN